MSLSPVNPLSIPADIQKQGAKAVSAYAEGLAFEQVLVSQLTKQLSAVAGNAGSDGSDSADGSDPTANDSGGPLGGGQQAGEYSNLIDGALTDALMQGGGLGIAGEVARGLDPGIKVLP